MTDNGNYEALVSAGIAAYDAKDRAHFVLGQLASEVETVYGDDSLGKYAADINAERARIDEYRRVWNFYQFPAVAAFYDTFANLRYSHWRDAMRLKTREAALAFLAEASDNGWLVEGARAELDRRAGKPVPGRKVAEFEAKCRGYKALHGGLIGMTFAMDGGTNIDGILAAWRKDEPIRVVVYALESAAS